jgi:hypothetical protein
VFTVTPELQKDKVLRSNNKELHRTTISLPVKLAAMPPNCIEV